jgi:hypothetical protein
MRMGMGMPDWEPPWVRPSTTRTQAIRDSDECVKFAILHGESEFIEIENPEPDGPWHRANTGMILHHGCMLERGYKYRPRWYPKRGSSRDPGLDDTECRQGRLFHRDPRAYDAYAACMADRGWTREPR